MSTFIAQANKNDFEITEPKYNTKQKTAIIFVFALIIMNILLFMYIWHLTKKCIVEYKVKSVVLDPALTKELVENEKKIEYMKNEKNNDEQEKQELVDKLIDKSKINMALKVSKFPSVIPSIV